MEVLEGFLRGIVRVWTIAHMLSELGSAWKVLSFSSSGFRVYTGYDMAVEQLECLSKSNKSGRSWHVKLQRKAKLNISPNGQTRTITNS